MSLLTIKRYEIPTDGEIMLPINAKVLSVDFYQGKFMVSAVHTTTYNLEKKRFLILGEGGMIKEGFYPNLKFITSIPYADNHLWYIFEVLNEIVYTPGPRNAP